MSTDAKPDADADADTAFVDTSFDIQVCTNDGRLLREFTLTGKNDKVTTLKSAEDHVRLGLSSYQGEPLVICLSEETQNKFRQVQIKVAAKKPKTHQATHNDA